MPLPADELQEVFRKRPRILELGNHAKVSRILQEIAPGHDFAWYETEVREVARK